MSLDAWDKDASPYHPGEEELHARLGRRERQERMGRQIHRSYMPDQHREFFATLPFMIAGSVDDAGWPWASILFGEPGFVSTPDARTLDIATKPVPGDPIEGVEKGAPVSFLGIELPTRRRNRLNGVVRERGEGRLTVDVVQCFGNCPQYIHTRAPEFARDPWGGPAPEIERFERLDSATAAFICEADSLFVASNNPCEDKRVNGGVDVNHRGGRPGFVKVDGDMLTIPDYIGNFAFNTLGNFVVNPRAGLLFIDYDTGDLLQLTGTVELLWEPDEEIRAFRGAERAWRFHLDHGQRLHAASPLRWRGGEASPNALVTGDWSEAEATRQAEAERMAWRPFRVKGIVDESASIRSFHFEPADGKGTAPYKPGQYLTIRVTPEGAERPQIRTYTLSSAPADRGYRISVKRDGAVSRHLHDRMNAGDMVETRAPNGSFWMDTTEARPAVLIAGGVGVTPMISMARQAVTEGFSRRHLRPLTVIHSTRNTAERAFAADFGALQKASEGGVRYVSVIGRPAPNEKAGRDFHVAGRITPEVLQTVLPLADHDFYLCGPPGFMQAVYDMLTDLGVQDERVFADSFGPASLKRKGAYEFEEPDMATVSFAASGVEATWTPESGTLLGFAEAQGLSPAFGCRRGACGSCAIRLASGNIGYRTIPLKKDC